jgi:hypothetical protein
VNGTSVSVYLKARCGTATDGLEHGQFTGRHFFDGERLVTRARDPPRLRSELPRHLFGNIGLNKHSMAFSFGLTIRERVPYGL